jgi:cytochrome c oxidase cbb3-type subunit 2
LAESKLTEWSEKVLESNSVLFTILATLAIAVGGLVEVATPMIMTPTKTVKPIETVKPYSPLELAGRDIYVREGCYNCHSQMIRPFKWETDRFAGGNYGEVPYSKGGEYVYDHPFQWGSKRTGPDLSHESQIKPSAEWHKAHLIDPRDTSPGSIMPAYKWLFKEGNGISPESLKKHMKAMNTLWMLNQGTEVGLPYSEADFESVESVVSGKTEGDALIAYILKLGRDTAE